MRSEILRYLGHRPIPITPKRLAISQYSGEWTSPYTGKGMDFRSHRPYELGDDPRSINMSMSVRAGKRMVVERIATRDISIFVLIDCSPSMGVRHKANMLMTTALMILYSGVNMEMRIGAALVAGHSYHGLGIGMGHRHAMRLFDKVEQACEATRYGHALPMQLINRGIYRLLPTGCILFYISDYLDEHGYPQSILPFSLNVQRFDFIPVVIQDKFEYSFPALSGSSLLELMNPESGAIQPIWFGKTEREMIKRAHEGRFTKIREMFSDHGIRFAHISDPQLEQVHDSLTRFFVHR